LTRDGTDPRIRNDIESRKKLVRYIAGMSGGDREALSKKGIR
jgi:hypothetical protein